MENKKDIKHYKHSSKYYSKLMNAEDAKVVRYEGLTLVDEYEIKNNRKEKPLLPAWLEREKEELRQEKLRREEKKNKDRQDLNLLVEETSSL